MERRQAPVLPLDLWSLDSSSTELRCWRQRQHRPSRSCRAGQRAGSMTWGGWTDSSNTNARRSWNTTHKRTNENQQHSDRAQISAWSAFSLCMFVSYRVEQTAGLVELHSVNGQLRLKVALLSQQVGYQNTNQVGAAGTRQNLDLKKAVCFKFHFQVVSLLNWHLLCCTLCRKQVRKE